jgi:NitT/TauT family transport system ATP-binding protein
MRFSIKNMDFAFDSGRPLFDGFSLELGDGNPTVILGPSGCGKTTLLRLIAGLLRPCAGTLSIEGAAAEAAASGVGPVSFVFQEARLLPYLSVLENVMLPIAKPLGAGAQERALFFLRESALADCASARPDALSGGQRQRAAIARAWAYPAPVILMDEPFQSLDIPLRIQLMDAVRALMRAEKRLVIAVTHDPREALYLGRRVIVLGGRTSPSPTRVILDERVPSANHEFASASSLPLERRLIEALAANH